MATTQVIDLLLQDGSDYESTVGILGLCYATVAAHAGAAYKRTPPQKTRARRLTGSLCAASTIRSLGFAAFAILTHIRVKSSFRKAIPSVALMSLCLALLYFG